MSAASIWVPTGQGGIGWIPSLAIPDLPYPAEKVWNALMIIMQGHVECCRPDRYIAQLLGRKNRFVQKGLKILEDLFIIRRIREHGRRRILILKRLARRKRPEDMRGDRPKTRAPGPTRAPTRPEQVPHKAAEPPPPRSPEEQAEFEAELDKLRSLYRPPARPTVDEVPEPPAPSPRPEYPPPNRIPVPLPPFDKIAARPESSSDRNARAEANREAQLRALAAMREARLRAKPRLADAVPPAELPSDQAAADNASDPAPSDPPADQAAADPKPGFLGRLFKRRE